MGYKVVDFRELVVLWYNEFLPERIGNKSVFVEDAGILYLKSIPLEPLRKDTIEFMTKKMAELSDLTFGSVVIGLNRNIADSVKTESVGGRKLGLCGADKALDKFYL